MNATAAQAADAPDPGMTARVHAFDWAATPLGAMADWPAPLGFAWTLCEHSSFPTAIYWGADLRLIYNDAWAPIPGERHPWALGRPAAEVWSDIWSIVGPQFEQVMASAEGFAAYEQMLPMVRDGAVQETYWNYSFTPILDEDGAVVGVLNQGNEITATVIADRRLAFQVALADRLRGLADPEAVKAAAIAMLGAHLGASRVGYAEIDADGALSIRGDWTRDASIRSLAGGQSTLAELGAGAADFLGGGQIVVVDDFRALPDPLRDAPVWEEVGSRALVAVPLVRGERLAALLWVHDEAPRHWRRSEVAIARDVLERTTEAVERAASEQALRESEDHFRHAVELNPQISWTATPDGRLNRVSGRWFDWTGSKGLGDSWMRALHPDDVSTSMVKWNESLQSGQAYDVEHRLRQGDGTYLWARSRAYARRDDEGRVILWYGATEDIDERKRGEEHQRLLINELNHRVKNTLATVQAIAFQTLKGDIPLGEARARFEARLMALSRAHNLLTEQSWDGAPITDVVANAIEPLAADRDRFVVEGEAIWVAPRAALALSLALHELATNAVKYGALSREGGRVSIDWRADDGRLAMVWKESGGPPVVEPSRRGFGSRLIERGLESDLGGSARILFESDGVRCTIDGTLEVIQAREDSLG